MSASSRDQLEAADGTPEGVARTRVRARDLQYLQYLLQGADADGGEQRPLERQATADMSVRK